MADVDKNNDNVISYDEFNDALTGLLKKAAGVNWIPVAVIILMFFILFTY